MVIAKQSDALSAKNTSAICHKFKYNFHQSKIYVKKITPNFITQKLSNL